MQKQVTLVLNKLDQDIKEKFDWLTFSVEVLSGDRLEIVASFDRTYYINYNIILTGVTYINGHLTWTWDDDEPFVAEILDSSELNDNIPILQDESFIIRFRNSDIGIHCFTVMAKTLEFSNQKLDAQTFQIID